MRRAALVLLLASALAAPLEAQTTTAPDPGRLSIRPYAAVSMQRFAAKSTFDAIFGSATGALPGGGVLVTRRRLFVEVDASRFRRNGERAFASDEDGFGVGIPLTVTIAPIEISAGYRFRPQRFALTPYVGGGIGVYRYREESPTAEAGENVSATHAGWLMVAGAERRLHRYLAVSADLRYTHVPGILGQGGLSKAVEENNLGGLAIRVRFVVGR
jgi:opacity protein-like surface antigen